MRLIQIVLCTAVAFILMGTIVGCERASSPKTGIVNLSVTDAPVDSAAAFYVTFVSATLQGVEGAADAGPVAIPEENQLVNLMDFQGTGSAVLVSGLEVAAGTYKVRLDADLTFNEEIQKSWIAFDKESSDCVNMPDGALWSDDLETCRYPIEIPSGEQSWFKPKGDATVVAGGTSSFTVEFDLRKNVTYPSDETNTTYKLKPTGLRLVNDTEVGTISGTLDAEFLIAECEEEPQALVYLFDREGAVDEFTPDDIHPGNAAYVASVAVNAETVEEVTTYSYLIGFILPGTYAVALTCDLTDDPDVVEVNFPFIAQAENVLVVVNENTTQDLPPVEP